MTHLIETKITALKKFGLKKGQDLWGIGTVIGLVRITSKVQSHAMNNKEVMHKVEIKNYETNEVESYNLAEVWQSENFQPSQEINDLVIGFAGGWDLAKGQWGIGIERAAKVLELLTENEKSYQLGLTK